MEIQSKSKRKKPYRAPGVEYNVKFNRLKRRTNLYVIIYI